MQQGSIINRKIQVHENDKCDYLVLAVRSNGTFVILKDYPEMKSEFDLEEFVEDDICIVHPWAIREVKSPNDEQVNDAKDYLSSPILAKILLEWEYGEQYVPRD